MRVRRLALIVASVWGCSDDSAVTDGGNGDHAPLPFVPDGYCPGSPGCLDEGDGVLHAGAAMLAITPDLTRIDVQTLDVNANGEFNPADGDMFEDRDGNGQFNGAWIAGFGNARAASGVMDDQ